MNRANLFALAAFVTVFSTGLLLHAARQILRTRPAALMRARLFALNAAAAQAVEETSVTALFHEQTRRWRFWMADGGSLRGVNLMRVSDGKIVEAMGYVKG